MSAKLPVVAGAEVVQALERAGFVVARVRGSHHVMKHGDGRLTVVPVHSGESIGPGLLRKVLRDCDLDREQFRELLG